MSGTRDGCRATHVGALRTDRSPVPRQGPTFTSPIGHQSWRRPAAAHPGVSRGRARLLAREFSQNQRHRWSTFRVTPVTDVAACHRDFRLPLRHAPPIGRRLTVIPVCDG
jgi:hypothetical protein